MRENDEFKTVLNDSKAKYNRRFWGRNTKDIFLLINDFLFHYNSADMEYLFYFWQPDVTP